MAEDKIRLGGMALANGVLVHGPQSWACAVRTADGELKVAAELKRFRAREVDATRCLRGPARIAEVFALLPAGAPPAARGEAAVRAAARCSRRWSATAVAVQAVERARRA